MIIQSVVAHKPEHSTGEDVVGCEANCIWCLDGATPPTKNFEPKITRELASTASAAIQQALIKNNQAPLSDVIANTIGVISEAFSFTEQYKPYCTLSIARFAEDTIEYLILGDSYFYALSEAGEFFATDERLKEVATEERDAVRTLSAMGLKRGNPEYDKARNALIAREAEYRNSPKGFWVLSDEIRAVEYAIQGSLPAKGVSSIACMSDGFFRLTSHLEKPIPKESLLTFIISEGPAIAAEKLRKSERDYAWDKKISSSKHDDASIIIATRNQ